MCRVQLRGWSRPDECLSVQINRGLPPAAFMSKKPRFWRFFTQNRSIIAISPHGITIKSANKVFDNRKFFRYRPIHSQVVACAFIASLIL